MVVSLSRSGDGLDQFHATRDLHHHALFLVVDVTLLSCLDSMCSTPCRHLHVGSTRRYSVLRPLRYQGEERGVYTPKDDGRGSLSADSTRVPMYAVRSHAGGTKSRFTGLLTMPRNAGKNAVGNMHALRGSCD